MSTPTNIPETPMGETEHDSYLKPEEKFKQQLQDIFQVILRVNKPDQFDQLCQWMEYKQFQTFDYFYDFYRTDSEKLDAKNPEAEYKWKGKTNYLSANVAHKLKSFVQWMAHEKRPHDLHDDYLSTLTRENYFNFRFLCTQSPTLPPSHHEPYKHQVKKRPQRKAFFPQQEGISDDDENTNEEEQFSTDQEPEEPSPYSVYQSSSHPKMPQKSFLPPNIWGTPPESTKQMIIEHNKKVRLNNPTPYLSGSKTKPNPPLGKPTPTSKQVHQHSQDEPTGESKYQTPSESLTALNNFKKGTKRDASALPQFLTHHNCDDLDPTDTPSAVPTALQAPSDDTYYPILMKANCTHNPSTSQVSKSYHANPVPSYMIFPSHGSTSRRLTGETNSKPTTQHMNTCSWKLTGEANSTTPHVDALWLTGKVMQHTLLDTRPQKLIGVVMTLMNLITLHPCTSSILMTYWGEPSSYLWMRMGRERGLLFLNMSRISVNNKSQEKISSDSSSRLMETNLMTSFHITNLWNT